MFNVFKGKRKGKCFLEILGMILALGIIAAVDVYAAPAVFGPALQGSYVPVTMSTTTTAGPTRTLVGGSKSARSICTIKNIGATYDLYWGEGYSAATADTWHKLKAREETTIYTCNFAPGTYGYTNNGIYVNVTPSPWAEAMVEFKSYKLLR